MRGLSQKRFLTEKAIKRHQRTNSVQGRKNNCLTEKMREQPHRLYKGRNYKNYGGYAFNTKNLGPSPRDRRNEIDSREQLSMWKHEIEGLNSSTLTI